jgi:hypothetical protein
LFISFRNILYLDTATRRIEYFSISLLIRFNSVHTHTLLTKHGYTKVHNLTHGTIRELASMVLQDNFFGYGEQICRQKTVGAMGSTFTLTLANIFMWKWEQRLVERQRVTGEFYGR